MLFPNGNSGTNSLNINGGSTAPCRTPQLLRQLMHPVWHLQSVWSICWSEWFLGGQNWSQGKCLFLESGDMSVWCTKLTMASTVTRVSLWANCHWSSMELHVRLDKGASIWSHKQKHRGEPSLPERTRLICGDSPKHHRSHLIWGTHLPSAQ